MAGRIRQRAGRLYRPRLGSLQVIAIQIDDSQAMSVLGPLESRMSDMTQLFRDLLITALDQGAANIKSQGAFAGLTWAPMAEFTQHKPPSMGGPRNPAMLLEETGVLAHILEFDAKNGQTFKVGPDGGSAGIFRPT